MYVRYTEPRIEDMKGLWYDPQLSITNRVP